MPTKYYHELTQKDKKNIQTQEIYEDLSKIKLLICGILVIVSFCDWVLENTLKPVFLEEGSIIPFSPNILLIVMAIIIYIASFLPFLARLAGTRLYTVKVILNGISNLLFSIFIFINQSYKVQDALQTNKEEDWFQAYTDLSSSIYITPIIGFMCPVWYFILFPCGAFYLGTILPFIKLSHPQIPWVISRNLVSFVYVIAGYLVGSRLRWQGFLKKLELSSWNNVYNYILNTNPSSIAILDDHGKIIYSNNQFDKSAEGKPEKFFEKISQLRLRSSALSPQVGGSISLNNEEFKNLLSTEDYQKKPVNFFERKNHEVKPKFANLGELMSYYRECIRTKKLQGDEQVIYDGKTIPRENSELCFSYEIIIRPLTDYKKIVVILNNTTERDLIIDLENSNEYKDQLLASVSHELRTPLNGNLGLLQAAIDDPSVPEASKANLLLPAYRSGRLLFHLMSDLLDYFHLLTDKLVLCYESKSLKETLEYCYQLLEDAFCAKDLTFNLTIDENLPPLFRTDHNRLTQVVLNLLTNALKFTMTGNVTITVEFKDDQYAKIQVKDTGIGITQDDMLKLFDEDNLIQRSMRKNKIQSKGVGLGLKVTSRLAKLLGPPENRGIQVKSAPEKGSCFSFTIVHESPVCSTLRNVNLAPRMTLSIPEIPLEFVESLDPTPSRVIASLSSNKKWTFYKKKTSIISEFLQPSTATRQSPACILVVDDDPFNILALESQLAQLGFIVDSANNGKQALEKVAAQINPYRLIFMDCQMPIMDGYQASRKLTHEMAKGKLPTIPIIGCTAFTDKDRIAECIKCGMKQVLNKPVMKSDLEKVLKLYTDLPR